MSQEQIHELIADPDYPGLTFADEALFDFLFQRSLKPLQGQGDVFNMIASDEGVNPATVQFPDLVSFTPGFCCFGSNAWACLSEDLNLEGETVRLLYPECGRDDNFIMFQPTEFDVLDFERSTVHRFSTQPYRVRWVDDLVLRNVCAGIPDIFRVEHLSTRLFCTESCRRTVIAHKLRGFLFQEVPVSDRKK